ncbi:MAG: cell envelope integrity protein CreD [Desulfobacteraceae bacterium]|nr:cell envelope integrity protein CreD [Desulfobacteraceae bacterium]
MSAHETMRKTSDFIRNSATLKMFSIGILVLVLLIPTTMVSSVMRERENRRDDVVAEINWKWGTGQTITGPFFTIPYKSYYMDEHDKLKHTLEHLHLLPEKLDISGEIHPQIRYRSIYEAVLYNVTATLNGHFKIPDLEHINIEKEDILWDKAVFSVGISDMRGIRENIVIQFNDAAYQTGPGLKTGDLAESGVMTAIPLSARDTRYSFSFDLSLNGSDLIHITPVAETTTVSLKSNWPSPSFNGSFLPARREITGDGFQADWKILHLNRNYPQYWTGSTHNVGDSSFGLELMITADIYQKSTRIAKYAIMFIIFTFAAFFFAEIINRRRVHPIQYILIGLGIILFYVLLLSISEHIYFNAAYLISATAVTLLITGYSKGILKNNYFTVTVFGILVVLYAYLFVVLQLEDYALLMGSIGLFIVLGTVMYITRSIDWYALNNPVDGDDGEG